MRSEDVFPGSMGDPPIPVVSVSVSAPPFSSGHARDLTVPLDTCSGPTVISEQLSAELHLIPSDSRTCITYEEPGGREYSVCAVEVTLQGSFIDIVQAVVMPIQTQMLLGRNVLNRLRMTLDASVGLVVLEGSDLKRGP